MDAVTLQQLRDILGKSDRLAIALGRTATLDEMAAALSLYLALSQMQKRVSIASALAPTVEFSSLVGINKVKTMLEGDGGDLVVSFPYREGEIEKVSYTIDNGFLNIVVKAGELGLNFQESDVRFSRGGGAPTVLIVIGTPRLSDLGTLFNPEALKNTTIVNIDNKADNQGYGDLLVLNPNASSVSEIIASILTQLGADIDLDIAQNLLSGILYGTQNFQIPQTSSVAFEMAGYLMKRGAVRAGGVAPQAAAAPLRTKVPANEDRVSSFMPEQMKAAPTQLNRPPLQTPPMSTHPQVAPTQQPARGAQKPPSDWLTPKVYKGSDNLG